MMTTLRVCPGCDAPACLCPFQRYCKSGGLLNGFPMLLVGVAHGSRKVRAIAGDVDSPRRAQRGVPVRNPTLLVVTSERRLPIRARRGGMPLVRRKFVDNRCRRVTQCQRRLQRVFIKVI